MTASPKSLTAFSNLFALITMLGSPVASNSRSAALSNVSLSLSAALISASSPIANCAAASFKALSLSISGCNPAWNAAAAPP